MFDWAEVLLGSCNHLTDVGDHAIAICTVSAVKFFNKIQIVELLPIVDDVITAANFFDAVNRKAGQLKKGDKEIRDQQWNNHGVNDRASEQVLRPVGNQPAKEVCFQAFMRFLDRLFEFDALTLNLEKHSGLLLA